MTMSIFIYGDEDLDIVKDPNASGQHIFEYAEQMLRGEQEIPLTEKEMNLLQYENLSSYLKRCSTHYIMKSIPQHFLRQMLLFHKVSGTEAMEVIIEV